MNRETKDELTNAGAQLGATVFGRLMDRVAEKNPHGLVARFRRTFGRITPTQFVNAGRWVASKVKRK